MLILECSQGCYGRREGRTEGRKDGRADGSITISLCNFVGEGIKISNTNSLKTVGELMYFGRVTVLTYPTCYVSLATTSVTEVIVESFLHLFCWLYFACFHFLSPLGEVCSIQHFMIKFVCDFRQIGGFIRVLLLPPLQ
jgi:hypothetical protein